MNSCLKIFAGTAIFVVAACGGDSDNAVAVAQCGLDFTEYEKLGYSDTEAGALSVKIDFSTDAITLASTTGSCTGTLTSSEKTSFETNMAKVSASCAKDSAAAESITVTGDGGASKSIANPSNASSFADLKSDILDLKTRVCAGSSSTGTDALDDLDL